MSISKSLMSAGAATVACIVLLSAEGKAWCPVFGGGPGNGDDYYAFEAENSATSWINTIDSPTLNTDPTSSKYWQHVIEHQIDTATQAWSRDARVRAKIGFKGWFTNPPMPWSSDGREAIVTEACPQFDPFPFAMYTVWEQLANPSSCDIVIRRGGCITQNLATGAASNGIDTGNFARSLRHEMGHCMGLAHPATDGSGCDEYGNCGCERADCIEEIFGGCIAGQVMCQQTCNRFSEHPIFDDINGHHAKLTGSGDPTKRRVNLGLATVSVTDVFADQEVLDTGKNSTFPARIDCRQGTSTPDCVMVRADGRSILAFDRVTFAATTPRTIQTIATTNVAFTSLTRSPDVALGGAGYSVAVAYHSLAASVFGTRALVFNTSTGQFVSSTELDPTAGNDNDVTYGEPRVTFVRGLGGTGRFLVAVATRSRTLAFYLSADANGGGPWTLLTLSAGALGGVFDGFDLHCPKHQATGSGDAVCRIVLTPNFQSSQNGAIQMCRLTVSTTSVTVNQCQMPISNERFSSVVALSDYGTGVPTDQRATTSWLVSFSRESPDVSGLNSRLHVYEQQNVFSPTYLDVDDSYGIDFQGCTAFGLGDDAESYFGGGGVDYCEFCDRIVRVGLGSHVTGGFGDKCF